MDAHTFMRSLFALRRYFAQIAEAGFGRRWTFHALERCGIAAEARMLAATGGINTHRGAIFMLGLLCAAAGAALREHGAVRLHPAGAARCLAPPLGRCAGHAHAACARAAGRHRRAAARPAQRIRRSGAGIPGAVRDRAARR